MLRRMDPPKHLLYYTLIAKADHKLQNMYYVYILASLKVKGKFYIGLTNNLERRLKEHDDPASDNYTYRYRPWKLETYIVFQRHTAAKNFESYLKTGSGRAFLRHHLT